MRFLLCCLGAIIMFGGPVFAADPEQGSDPAPISTGPSVCPPARLCPSPLTAKTVTSAKGCAMVTCIPPVRKHCPAIAKDACQAGQRAITTGHGCEVVCRPVKNFCPKPRKPKCPSGEATLEKSNKGDCEHYRCPRPPKPQ